MPVLVATNTDEDDLMFLLKISVSVTTSVTQGEWSRAVAHSGYPVRESEQCN